MSGSFNVKVLCSGNPPVGVTRPGDLICVCSQDGDWGTSTASTQWVRAIIEGVEAASQDEADNIVRGYCRGYDTAFTAELAGQPMDNVQRYRVSVIPAMAGTVDSGEYARVRDRVLTDHKGTLLTDDGSSFEFDAEAEIPLDEFNHTIAKVEYRRYQLSDIQGRMMALSVGDAPDVIIHSVDDLVRDKLQKQA